MRKYVKYRDSEKCADIPIWTRTINKLLEERDVTQQKLAIECDIPPSVISDWIGLNRRSKKVQSIPRVDRILKIAQFFDVSVDFLLGNHECETPSDEKIHEITGLSGLAIQDLKRMKAEQGESVTAEKQLAITNYLLENISKTELFESLYDYLIGKFSFPGKEDDMGAAFMVEHLPSGKDKQTLTFKDVFSQAVFVYVQEELFHLKKLTMENSSKLQGKVIEEK